MDIPVSGLKLIVRSEVTQELTGINIRHYQELVDAKMIYCWIDGSQDPITLWSGNAYDAIGQWTDAQAYDRLSGMAVSGIAPFKL